MVLLPTSFKYILRGMTSLERMYKKGVPVSVIFAEARIQARAGTLEIGAREFLLSIGWSG